MRYSFSRLRGGSALFTALVIAGSLLVSAAATASAQTTPVAHKASTCSISKVWHSLGPTYVEQLSVTNVSCSTGESEIKAYNSCRLKNGGAKGKCTSKVNGYTCKEERETGADQFVAKATCTKSRDQIVFTYSENF